MHHVLACFNYGGLPQMSGAFYLSFQPRKISLNHPSLLTLCLNLQRRDKDPKMFRMPDMVPCVEQGNERGQSRKFPC